MTTLTNINKQTVTTISDRVKNTYFEKFQTLNSGPKQKTTKKKRLSRSVLNRLVFETDNSNDLYVRGENLDNKRCVL